MSWGCLIHSICHGCVQWRHKHINKIWDGERYIINLSQDSILWWNVGVDLSLSPSKLGIHEKAIPFNIYVLSMIELLSPSKFDNEVVVVKWMLVSDTTSKIIEITYEMSSTSKCLWRGHFCIRNQNWYNNDDWEEIFICITVSRKGWIPISELHAEAGWSTFYKFLDFVEIL